jgi:tRNA(Ile)-lysidine synthase
MIDPSFEVRAIHIHHGLSDNADYWEEFCEATADEMSVPYAHSYVECDKVSNVEAKARTARYGALTTLMDEDETLITGHHQDDQLETLLLALKRGTGLDGLCAMARDSVVHGLRVYRPLLDTPRNTIEEFARDNGLEWIEDESNQDLSFDRNFLRHEIIPSLQERWPTFRSSATRASAALQLTRQALTQLTDEKLAEIEMTGHLSVSSLTDKDTPFKIHLIREWVKRMGLKQLSFAQVNEVIRAVIDSRYAQKPVFKLPSGHLITRIGDQVFINEQ